MSQTLLERAKSAFFDAMCQREPFSALVHAAHELLEWPVLVGDDASNVILQIPERPIGSVWYDALLEERRVHPELFIHFQEAMRKVYNPDNDAIRMIPGEDQSYPLQVCISIRIYNVLTAQVIFHVPSPEVNEEEREVLSLFYQAATAECAKASRHGPMSTERTSYHMKVLLEGTQARSVLEYHAQNLAKSLAGDYLMMVTLLEDSPRQETFIPFYMGQVSKLADKAVSIVYEGNVVTLFSGLVTGQESLERLWQFTRSCAVVVGTTMPFGGSLTKISTMYQQALLTARLGRRIRPKELIFNFDVLAPLQTFVPAVLEYDIKTFLHPSIVHMMEADEQNGTEYLRTLQAYLVTGKSNRETIRLLSVHQNTLLYRLTRIKELFDVDFNDGRQTLTLLTNILLLEVARPDLLPLFKLDT